MANLKKTSKLQILKSDLLQLIQTHYPNLYAKLSSNSLLTASLSDDGLSIVFYFADGDDGNQ